VLVTADTFDKQLTRNLQKKGSYSLARIIHEGDVGAIFETVLEV